MQPKLPRRSFLKTAPALAAPWIVPRAVFGAAAPSNRIEVACIGTGNQGFGILRKFLRHEDVQVTAVCDVNRASYGYKTAEQFLGSEPARAEVDGSYAAARGKGAYRSCKSYRDFRDVLARKDVEAVTVVTPDHWHALMTIRAAEAGKDVYCEKPLSLTIGQGRAMVEAVRKHRRILQVGSHERSNGRARHVCELVRNGRIGQVRRVVTNVGRNNKTGPGPGWRPTPVPEGFDYDLWLGPAPKVPYHKDRCLYRFRFNYDYSGGQVTNFGAHSNDLAQWGLDADATGPVEIEYLDAKWLPEGSLFNTALETRFRCRYAGGVELLCETGEPAVKVRFEGTEGAVEWGYGVYRSEPESLLGSKIGPNEIRLPRSDDHVRNFLDCVRSREEPIAPVEVGHRSAAVCHLGVAAVRLGRDLRWDPVGERFLDDEEADAMLTRPIRDPWRL